MAPSTGCAWSLWHCHTGAARGAEQDSARVPPCSSSPASCCNLFYSSGLGVGWKRQVRAGVRSSQGSTPTSGGALSLRTARAWDGFQCTEHPPPSVCLGEQPGQSFLCTPWLMHLGKLRGQTTLDCIPHSLRDGSSRTGPSQAPAVSQGCAAPGPNLCSAIRTAGADGAVSSAPAPVSTAHSPLTLSHHPVGTAGPQDVTGATTPCAGRAELNLSHTHQSSSGCGAGWA